MELMYQGWLRGITANSNQIEPKLNPQSKLWLVTMGNKATFSLTGFCYMIP